MSIGYYLGGRLADRQPRVRTLVGVLVAAAGMTAIVPWLDAMVAQRVFDSSIPLGLHSAVVTLALFVLPTLALASVSPIAIRLLATEVTASGRTAGTISAISTFGSIAGSLGTAFVLLDLIRSVDRTVWLLSIVTLICALVVGMSTLGTRASVEGMRRVAGVTVAVAGAGVVLALSAAWVLRVSPTEGIDEASHEVYRRDSRFHQIVVEDHPPYRVLFFDRIKQSRMKLGDPLDGGLAYTDFFHFARVVKPELKTVLFIGVGGGTGPTRFAHDYPGISIDAVDVDPVVLEVAGEYFGLEAGPRLRLHAADGRAFLRRSTEKYDAIVIDAYSQNRYGSTIPAHLTTKEFFEECRDRLAPGGIIVFNCAWEPSQPVTRAIARTLGEVFPGQLAFSRANTVFIAGPESIEPLRLDLDERTHAARASGALKFPLDGTHVAALIPPIVPGDAPLLTDDYAPVDTLIRRGNH
jgi:spermidine synthase